MCAFKCVCFWSPLRPLSHFWINQTVTMVTMLTDTIDLDEICVSCVRRVQFRFFFRPHKKLFLHYESQHCKQPLHVSDSGFFSFFSGTMVDCRCRKRVSSVSGRESSFTNKGRSIRPKGTPLCPLLRLPLELLARRWWAPSLLSPLLSCSRKFLSATA